MLSWSPQLPQDLADGTVPLRQIARVLATGWLSAKAERRTVGAGGKRLDAARDAATLHAALDGLAESGDDRLTMEDIAARAHAGKGALYRRWSSKEALVIGAVEAWRKDLAPIKLPDTGSLGGCGGDGRSGAGLRR